MSGASDFENAALDRTEIAFEPWSWRFAAERRDEINRHFAEVQRRRPGVWNGRILLMQRYAIADGVLRGACFEADYASFCAWRDWNFPDTNVYNVFAAAALRSADGAFVVGEMAASTFNAGLLTFPCGTPEPADLDADGMLDLGANLGRELMEETGLPIDELKPEPGWKSGARPLLSGFGSSDRCATRWRGVARANRSQPRAAAHTRIRWHPPCALAE